MMLERAGGKVDMRNASGMTPLAYSAGQGNVKALQTLIDRGANVHTRNKDGTTPLHQAASSGNQVTVAPYSLGHDSNEWQQYVIIKQLWIVLSIP